MCSRRYEKDNNHAAKNRLVASYFFPDEEFGEFCIDIGRNMHLLKASLRDM